ncbi:toxin-antitoxin system YwqK family antitoxin [Marinoscillum luteum]|uniref:Type IV secretion system putative lipoprotein virB7 n=1 Tax=Marinoscillum luteum TaxID=861051 RepID=A0ABW7NFF2_9BACT
MNKFLLVLGFLLVLTGCGQRIFPSDDGELQKVTTKAGDDFLEFRLTRTKVNPDPNREYFWFKSGQLQSTRGSFSGYLLDGEFTRMNQEGQLSARGEFKDGLKTGTWYSYEQGDLVTIETYRKGQLSGKSQDLLGGEVVEERIYKSGVLNGFRKELQGDSVKQIKYRGGVPTDTTYLKSGILSLDFLH